MWRRLARSDQCNASLYPGFDEFYKGLDTRLEKDAVRWLARYHARRQLGDRLGRELVGDLVDDAQLQAGLLDLLKTMKIDPSSIPGLRCIAPESAEEEADRTHLTFILNFFEEDRRRVPTGKN